MHIAKSYDCRAVSIHTPGCGMGWIFPFLVFTPAEALLFLCPPITLGLVCAAVRYASFFQAVNDTVSYFQLIHLY